MTDLFPDAAAELAAAADSITGGADPATVLSGRVPWLEALLRQDAAAGSFENWSLSSVIDENVGAPVIPRALFELLHTIAGIEVAWPHGNAGVLHVYGYLLSAVATPFGFKRDRWIDGQLATALSQRADAFVPWSNSHSAPAQRILRVAAPLLREPTAASELVLWIDDSDGDGLVVRTVVVRDPASDRHALLYGQLRDDNVLLTTTFPVADASAGWRDTIRSAPPRLRYNACAPGLSEGAELTSRLVRYPPGR